MNKRNYGMMTFVLFWTGFAVMCSLYVTIPLTPVFMREFGLSADDAAWTGSIFSIFFALGCLVYGPVSDRFGRKQVIVAGLVFLTVFTVLIGFADSLPAIILFRALQGAAAASFSPVALAYAGEMFPQEKRGTAIGFISTGFLLAGIGGQVIASFISEVWNWNAVFWLMSAVYLLTMWFNMLLLPKGDVKQKSGHMFSSFSRMGDVLHSRSLLIGYVVTITVLFTFVGMYSALGFVLTHSPYALSSGQILFVRSAGILGMVCSPIAGRLISKHGSLSVLRTGLIIAAAGLLLMSVSGGLTVLVVMSVVFVLGIAIAVPSLISLIGQLGGEMRGLAVSLYTFILFIGASLGPIFTAFFLKSDPFLVLSLVLFISVVLSFLISRKPSPVQAGKRLAKN
ncbi:MFS transporter [Bacillus sonorensis]|uniref:MFS transporter n=1 Tax=Bacillus sonorensis TaxID=119858 RepID=UPI00098B5E1A|nr:MFS transporter [Bacillus sonorensis]